MDEQERFEQICQPTLERIENSINELTIAIKGNGHPGLTEKQSRQDERIKVLESGSKWLWGVLTTISSSLVLYAILSTAKVIAAHQAVQISP